MKKLLSITLTLVLMLSLCVPAFAEVTVDGESEGAGTVSVECAQYVSVDHHEDDLTVTGSVTGKDEEHSVYARNGIITVDGNVTESGDYVAIDAKRATVTVEGDVSESGNGYAIHADNSTIHVGGSVEERGGDHAISATEDAKVEIDKDVTESGDGVAIYAKGSDTTVTVHGEVTEEDADDAINAQGGATVVIDEDVTESGIGTAIFATGDNTTVTVKGNVTEDGQGDAIDAQKGATVTVEGNVTESGDGRAVTVDGATVVVLGNVDSDVGSVTVYLKNGTVKIGGNVNGLQNDAGVMIVEGTVNGDIESDGQTYIGSLTGTIDGSSKSNVHYLIGIAPEGSVALSEVAIVSAIVADGTVDGVNEEGYRYTTTADKDALNGKTIILKPADGKILTVSGFEGANVQYLANEDGTVTFTLGDSFTGGLQNLVLILADKPASDSEPVYYIVSLGSVTVVEFTAPDGVAEGLIKALESADHAGITVDSSLVGDGSVKVLKDGEELNANDFSIYTHADGSIDVILSNTYLFALGSGSYDFTAIVNGLEIPFTVVVEK